MGVYIRGMEMPKHCGECGIEWCNRWKKLIVAGMPCAKSRPSDCPLIPVPDHGRLIDADAAERHLVKMQQAQKDITARGVRKSRAVLRDIPTIIPADGQDTNVPTGEEGE